MFRTCYIQLSFRIITTYTIKNIVLRPSQRLSTLLSVSIKFFLRNSRSFLLKSIANLIFPYLFKCRREPLKCSDQILPLSIISIFRELQCLLKFDVFNLAIPLSDLSIMCKRMTLDSCNEIF